VAVDEMMGYLPGNIDDKMNPWTRPMFDVFENYFTATRMKQLLTDKTIEIAPLGFMRGRTLSNTFIVADEMQNSTTNQMKMLLTRIGENSKMVLTGDLEQCDLPPSTMNGLVDIVTRVQSYDRQLQYIDLVVMDHHDIQRHPTVSEILEVYKKQD
jgi:phosphate starvation-inducible PhoH-like protein